MSAYQCYEFVALDRPLTSEEMAKLRRVSSRAEISPTRFWNEYQYGDFKGDPVKLVEKYFDAHMYSANWGSRRLILRLPLTRVDSKRLKAYFVGGTTASARVTSDYLILDLETEDEGANEEDENPGTLATLTPIRTELIRGDLRGAYLAWLRAVQEGQVDDDAEEPAVPPGLSDLTAAQAALVEFFRIDEDLIAAAAEASEAETVDLAALRRWVLGLSPRKKDEWLRRAIDDPDLALGGDLLAAFRAQLKPPPASKQRTVAQLWEAVEKLGE